MTKGIITLGVIRAAGPCVDGWRTLLRSLGFTDASYPSDYEISIGDVAISNGAADAMWCLRCIDDPRTRVRAVMPAVRRAAEHTTDERVHDCIAAVERWLDGDDAVDLKAAAEAAAAWAAAWAARAVAEAAAAAEAAAWALAAAWSAEEERKCQAADLIRMFPPIRLGRAA